MSVSSAGEFIACTTPASSSGTFGSNWMASTARSFSCRKRASISGLGSSAGSTSATRATMKGQPSRNSSTRNRDCPWITRWWEPSVPVM